MLIKQVLFSAVVTTIVALSATSPVSALDTDIYFTDPSAGSTVIKPNLMLILDTSGSMNMQVAGTNQSRVDVMKGALKTILDELTNVNVGLMRFSSSPGGPVMYPVRDIDATVTDTGKIQTVMQDAQDDAQQGSTGSVTVTGTALAFNSANPYTGIRFQDVYIPQGVTITSAKIVLQAAATRSGSDLNLAISADNVDNAQTYAAVTNDITSTTRPQTAATVAWNNVPDWTLNNYYDTPDIRAVVQEVVNRPGWCRGNAMAFRFSYVSGTSERLARAYDIYNNNSSKPYSPGSAALVVTYDPNTIPLTSSCHQVVARVAQDTDDAEERSSNGNMTLTGVLQLVGSSPKQIVGLRFQNVAVPQGATITSARLEFEVDSTNSSTTSLTIQGENVDSAVTFNSTDRNISSRPVTTASVAWSSVPNLAMNQKLVSPDLTPVVQEIVNRAGWISGNAMAFIITGSGTKNVESFDSEPGAAPLLKITYSSNTAQTKTVRDVLKELVVGMRAEGATPIVDTLYEAALYYRGEPVDYGLRRGPGSGTFARWTRVSHPSSYTGGTVNRDIACTDNDLDAAACANETITGSPKYISPIAASCQPSHLVLLTDGDATVNNSAAKVLTMTGASSCSDTGSDACGVTLTGFLHTQDQSSQSDVQTVTTHTIGYQISNTFLQNLAGAGGGKYTTATDASSLISAFKDILNDVLKSPTSFVSPSLSVNAFNKLFNRDEVYFSLFSPQLTQAWPGNVKKYMLCNDSTDTSCKFGEVLDADALPAIGPDSKIQATARSFWSSTDDGPVVTLGAAGSQIPSYSTRRVYTYTGSADYSATPIDLTQAAHRVETANANLTTTILNAVDTTERNNIINWMRGQDIQDEDSDGVINEDRWRFADALHSRPVTISYGGTTADPIIKIVVGTNDGGLRMINATTGEEEWIVYLPEFLGSQKELMTNVNGPHLYGVDGSGSVLTIDNNNDGIIDPAPPENDRVYFYISMRRGGRGIYAFDITPEAKLTSSTLATGIKPKFMWRIDETSTGFGALGQTWSQPVVADVRVICPTGDTSCDDGVGTTKDSKIKTVLLFGGGYDPRLDQSVENAIWATEDTVGNAIFMVDPLTGARIWWASKAGSGADLELAGMKYAIPSDVALVDSDADGAADRIYVGDTRGQLWRIDLGDQINPNGASASARNGGSSGYVFADIGCTGGTRADNCAGTPRHHRRKFFYPPDVAQVRDPDFSATPTYDLITIGSGDREDPIDKHTKAQSSEPVHNRIYAFRDKNVKLGAPSTTPAALDETKLYDATNNDLQNPAGAGYPAALSAIQAADGWLIKLKEASVPNWIGEKVLAKTTIFGGQLFVTTFVPAQNTTGVVCPTPSEGTAKLYTLNYLNAAAVNVTEGRDQTLGGGIPSELVVVIREGGTTGLVGTSGGAKQPEVKKDLPRYKTFWNQK